MASVRLTTDLTTLRILVVDEDYSARETLCEALRERGFDVMEATDAEEALRLATSFPLDLAVVALELEPMRGDELIGWIAELNPTAAVVCTSRFPTFEAAVAAVRCGAQDFLEQPYTDLPALVEQLVSAIDRRQRAGSPAVATSDEQEEQSREADLKRRFLSAVAHELRTPLTVIKTFVEVLHRGGHGPLNPDQREVLEHVGIEADRLADEVDKLLSLARLESEDFAPDCQPVSVERILKPIRKRLQARAQELRIDLLFSVDDPEVTVLADAQDISQVLLALTENALKFTGEGGRVVVHVTTRGNTVHFEVLDTGIGIDDRYHDHIFEMFAQLENPLTRRHRGAGIGLPYALRIVLAHGSEITVDSRLGDGAAFAFALPVAPEADTQTVGHQLDLDSLSLEAFSG